MTQPPVTDARKLKAARLGLHNVEEIASASREVGIPFFAACALFDKESKGRNIYGHDKGGALSGFPFEVNRDNYRVFRWLVIDNGHVSNGVGPSQITWAGGFATTARVTRTGGYFEQMEHQGLKPWVVEDNMLFGLERLWAHFNRFGSWRLAGQAYNGASAYGVDLEARVAEWRKQILEAR